MQNRCLLGWFLLAGVLACSDATLGPKTGNIMLSVVTVGADLPVGYEIQLDDGLALTIPANDSRTLASLPIGSHSLLLSGVTANCTVNSPNPQQVDVAAGTATQVRFAVACVAIASFDINGTWDWTEQYTNPVCNDTGTYAFTQSGAAFTGRSDQVGTCQSPNGPADNAHSNDRVTGGQLGIGAITFQVGNGPFCFYTATVTGTPPDHLSGTTSCGPSTGTWQAVRGQPVASVVITSAKDTLLNGDTVQLAAQLRDAQGHRVFRTVAWSSDNSAVAIVSDSGRVIAMSVGAATIAATAPGTSGLAKIIVEQAGAVRITTATTGVDVDLDGYRGYVDGNWPGSQPVGIHGSVTLTRIRPGSHSILLGEVASNCRVGSPNPVTISVAGGDTIPLTFTIACVRTERIAFATAYYYGIYVMSANGGDAAPLATGPTATGPEYGRPAWSPDGTRLAFESARDGNMELYVVNGDGSGLTRLTNNTAFDGSPAWSPDGTRIAFTSGRDGQSAIYVMNPDGSGVVRVSNEQANEFRPAWSPDGKQIAFTSTRDGHYEVYVMSADGTAVTRLTNASAGNFDPVWSPDGTRIAFGSDRDGNSQIYVMNADGSGVSRLTDDSDGDWQPAWSPDGSRIAFTKLVQLCDDSGCSVNTSIYVVHTDGTGSIQLLGTNTGLDSDPAWRP